MPAYVVVDLHIYDIAAYLEYQHALRPLLQSAGARYLARGGEAEVLEGDMQPGCLIIVEFPSLEVLQDFYRSETYQSLESQRTACSRASIVSVNGLPAPVLPEN